jgi:hypothetical protein
MTPPAERDRRAPAHPRPPRHCRGRPAGGTVRPFGHPRGSDPTVGAQPGEQEHDHGADDRPQDATGVEGVGPVVELELVSEEAAEEGPDDVWPLANPPLRLSAVRGREAPRTSCVAPSSSIDAGGSQRCTGRPASATVTASAGSHGSRRRWSGPRPGRGRNARRRRGPAPRRGRTPARPAVRCLRRWPRAPAGGTGAPSAPARYRGLRAPRRVPGTAVSATPPVRPWRPQIP